MVGLFHYRFTKASSVSGYVNESIRPYPSKQSKHRYSSRKSAIEEFNQNRVASAYELTWRRPMRMLYIASGLIIIRSVFRVVEYLQGNNGYILEHEIFLYIFDALLMLVVICLSNWVHPAQITDLYQNRIQEEEFHSMESRNKNLRH
jgi:hypothetical protein